jgi:DNA (cytosine-5)-methyltransferase 1
MYKGKIDAVCGGPPCQPYSKLNNHTNQEKYEVMASLPSIFLMFCIEVGASVIVMEEVPAYAKSSLFAQNVALLNKNGYVVSCATLNSADYGVPQRRMRHFTVGLLRTGARNVLQPFDLAEHTKQKLKLPTTVGEALSQHPVPARGALISTSSLKWVKMKEAGLLSHEKPNWHTAAYGILRQDKPAPTITTAASSAGSGSFTVKRKGRYYRLSKEEAARLQSYPYGYKFVGSDSSVYKQIGNSVPPLLGMHIAKRVDAAMLVA